MLIFISGPKNAGKTTVSGHIAQKMERTVIVEVDRFFSFFPHIPAYKCSRACLEMALGAAEEFLARDQHVIIPYPLTESDYRLINQRFKNTEIHFVTLSVPLEIAKERQRDRQLSAEEEHCLELNYRLRVDRPSFGITLPSNQLTVPQITEIIQHQILNEKNGAKNAQTIAVTRDQLTSLRID